MGHCIRSIRPPSSALTFSTIDQPTAYDFILAHDFNHLFANRVMNAKAIEKSHKWGIFDENQLVGIILLEKIRQDGNRSMVHVALAPSIRGKKAIHVGKEWLGHAKQKYGKIVGFTPRKWRHACLFARMLKPTRTFLTPNYLVTEFDS